MLNIFNLSNKRKSDCDPLPLSFGFSEPEGEPIKDLGDFILLKSEQPVLYYKNSLNQKEVLLAEKAKGCIISRLAEEGAVGQKRSGGFASKLLNFGNAEDVFYSAGGGGPQIQKNSFEAAQRIFESASILEKKELARQIAFEITQSQKVAEVVAFDTFGYGPIEILNKLNLEEIELNSINENIYVYHPLYGRCKTNLHFKNLNGAKRVVNSMLRSFDKELNEVTPIVDSQLSNLRIHAQISPLTPSGIVFSIRVLNSIKPDVKSLIDHGAPKEVLAYLWMAVKAKMNIAIAGPPASGKTTLLNAILQFVENEKVVCIEEEINEIKKNGNYSLLILQSRRDKQKELIDQIINALRLRPQRLVVGEMRGREAKEVFSAAAMGIPFLTTLHANSEPGAILQRLESKPMEVEKNLIKMLDVGVYLNERRQVERIEEYGNATTEVNPFSLPKTSKVVRAYSKAYLLGLDASLKDFQKMVKKL